MASDRLSRLLRLITLLQSRQPRSPDDLAHEMGVSRRTIFRDLNALESAGVPYHHVEGQGYRINKSYYLPPVSLSAPEILGLMHLAKTAGVQRERPLHAPALSAIYKIISTVPEPVRTVCGEMMANISVRPDAHVNGDAESSHYNTLQRCIDSGEICRIQYTSLTDDGSTEIDFEPYTLHHVNRAWYVIGRSSLHDDVRTLKLIRIQEAAATGQSFQRPRQFRLSEKIGNAWQLIPEGKEHDIELVFSAKVARNVSEVKWHPSQEHQALEDGRCLMRFNVDGLGEIAWWLCSYADHVTVRKPKALAELVRGKHQRAAAQYD